MGKHLKERKRKLARRKAIRKWSLIGLAAAAVVVTAGVLCWQYFFGPPPGNTVVATIDGIDITADDVTPMVSQAEWKLQSENFDLFQDENIDYNADFAEGLTIAEAIRQEAVRLAANNVLLVREAERLDISLSAEDIKGVDADIDNIKSQLNTQSSNGFREALKDAGFRNEQHIRYNFRKNELTQRVIQAIIDDPEEFARFESLMDPEITDDSEDRAKAILARIRAGESFDDLMNEYSEDPGLQEYPDGYTFGPGEMVPEFEETTRSLAVGEIEMVKSDYGYHIIMRIEPDLEGHSPEEDLLGAKHILISSEDTPTLEERMSAAVNQGFETMTEEAAIRFNPILNRIRVSR
ncbi:MAG: peptidylprolyl isomerase [Clostridiales bacterium]|jgi:parvulin-like peptidyl-prolyl isomerase|nr:peptidylprolyl isomerase [Clostridiales bacterium]